MATGTFFQETLAYPITQSSLLAEIDKLLKKNPGTSDIGNFTTYDTYTNTDYSGNTNSCVTYKIQLSATSTYSIIYLNICVSQILVVTSQWFISWDNTQHTGTSGSQIVTSQSLSQLNNINAVNIYCSEYNLSFLQQNTVIIPIGFVRPTNIKSTVAEPIAIFPGSADLSMWNMLATNYFGNTQIQLASDIGNKNLSQPDANNQNLRDSQPGVSFYNPSLGVVWGKTSSDMVIMAATGTALFQQTTDTGSAIYRILSNIAGGLAVHTST